MPQSKRPLKAYGNLEFLNGPEARTIRILAEYHEPLARFRKYGIKNSIVFFGSARSIDHQHLKTNTKNPTPMQLRLAEYYEDAVELARRLTEWAMKDKSRGQRYYICTGGGPGMMEAANKGAYLAGGKSIGMNISLPMEQLPNPYITEELKFEFHYFFIRKFWFAYLAKAMVIMPGGFGTLDELMEVLTLIQTHKLRKNMPIVVFGSEFWNEVVDFKTLVKWGTINAEDLNLFHFSDSVDDAFEYLVRRIDEGSSLKTKKNIGSGILFRKQ